MKIRNGFVSNSSSSSFIMIGVDSKLLKTPINSESGIKSLFISEYGDVEEVTGFILVDEEYFEESDNISIQKINQKAEELVTKLNVDFSDVKLYYGTRPA